MARSAPRRFRSSRVALLGVVVLAVCTIPLAFASPWLAPLLLLPVVMAAYVVGTGTEASEDGIRVRRLGDRRTVAWSAVATVTNDGGRVVLTTTDGQDLRLPGVVPTDVPRLAAASGGRLRLGDGEV